MRYYIYKMNILDNDTYFGSYIGQHKIGRKCPFNDGYKGSGCEWRKYILDKHIPVEKTILRMCNSVEDANYWEKFYIKSAKTQGIYLWNRCKGGGSHNYNRVYTDEELAEHKRQCQKQYKESNKEKIAEYHKQYDKQYKESNKEKISKQMKQYREVNKEKITEYRKKHNNQLCQYNGEIVKLAALEMRFRRAGIEYPAAEAKKYLVS